MQKHILIVEDDNEINQMIRNSLENQGYRCTSAYSGTEALLYGKEKWDAIILDLMLPGIPGHEVLKEMKKLQDSPVLVASAIDSMDSKLSLLTGGADDYMTKPFNLDELVARIDILTRRNSGHPTSDRLEHKELSLNPPAFEARIDEKPLNLTKSEFKIMELLMKHPKQVFTKQEIYEVAWDDYYMGSDKTINVHISNLRKKISNLTDHEYIETVWGIGFKLKE